MILRVGHRDRTIKRAFTILVASLVISAAAPMTPDVLIKEANSAFDHGNYDEAIERYQQAEERGTDPGLIAFNKATAYYQLQDYRKAESHYRMAIDDGAIPADRRAKALYNLGDCLVKQADEKDLKRLRYAIKAFEMCLEMEPPEGLRNDAAHNLELAKLLWNKARAKKSDPPAPNNDDPPEDHKEPEPKKREKDQQTEGDNPDTEKEGKEPKSGDGDPMAKADSNGDKGAKADAKKSDTPLRDSGPPVLPDTDELQNRSLEDTLKALKEAQKRLHNERRILRTDASILERPSGKDW